MNDKKRQIILLVAIMVVLSALTIFFIQVSDTDAHQHLDNSESNEGDFSNKSRSNFSYNGPGASLINQSVQGLKDLRNDIDLSIFMSSKPEQEPNKTQD